MSKTPKPFEECLVTEIAKAFYREHTKTLQLMSDDISSENWIELDRKAYDMATLIDQRYIGNRPFVGVASK
jgi:hypothetical protein